MELSGKRRTFVGGAEYLMAVVDDFSWLGWPYFLKRKSDVPVVSLAS